MSKFAVGALTPTLPHRGREPQIGKQVWVLESELGAVSQVRRLDQAADEMREAIAYLAGVPENEVVIEVHPVLPDAYSTSANRADELATEVNPSIGKPVSWIVSLGS